MKPGRCLHVAFGPACREVGSGLGTQVYQACTSAWFFYTLPCRPKGQPYSLSFSWARRLGQTVSTLHPSGSPGQASTSSDHSAAPSSAALKLFDDPDLGGAVPLDDPLLLPAAPQSGGATPREGHREASEELFRYRSVMFRYCSGSCSSDASPGRGVYHGTTDSSPGGSTLASLGSEGGNPDPSKVRAQDFPGGPVAKTPSSQCKEPRFVPW